MILAMDYMFLGKTQALLKAEKEQFQPVINMQSCSLEAVYNHIFLTIKDDMVVNAWRTKKCDTSDHSHAYIRSENMNIGP